MKKLRKTWCDCLLFLNPWKDNTKQNKNQTNEYLDELFLLAKTAGAKPIKKITQKLAIPDPKTFLGKGKTEEVRQYVEENEIDIVIFDDELSPSQFRNVENIYNCILLSYNFFMSEISKDKSIKETLKVIKNDLKENSSIDSEEEETH